MKNLSLFVVLVGLVQFCSATVYPGEEGYAFRVTGTQTSSYGEIPTGSAFWDALGGSWTMELWFSLDQPIDTNTFQPIVSHFTIGGPANTYNDFNLQVWPNGQLVFFMGNGADTNGGYGILIYGTTVDQVILPNTWYHVAVVFEASIDVFPYTPDQVTVYLNGQLFQSSTWDSPATNLTYAGARQLAPVSPISIGHYDNSDPGFQVLTGDVDELRFWDYPKSNIAVMDGMDLNVLGEAGLLAYYKFDQIGNILYDATGDFNGAVRFVAGGETSPNYVVSGAIIDSTVSASNSEPQVITLYGKSDITATPTFYIASLPASGTLYLVSRIGTMGLSIDNTNIIYALPSNQVAYVANDGFVGSDSFTYAAKDSTLSSETATVYITVTEGSGNSNNSTGTGGCDGYGAEYDACGVCGGDGRSCTCIADQYRSYTLSELDRILVHYNIEYTLDLITALNTTLDETLSALYTSPTEVDLAAAVDTIQMFNQNCLQGFLGDMDNFLARLQLAAN